MAKGIREFNKKLASLRNTLKMTKTMKMVSASKLRRAQMAQRSSQAYAQQVNSLIGRLAGALEPGAHPLLTPHKTQSKALVLMLTSDRGLCGAFNNQMIRLIGGWTAEHADRFDTLQLSFCGRRGFSYFQKRAKVARHYEGVTSGPTFARASEIADELIAAFTDGTYDEVYLAHNVFESPLTQTATIKRLLPLQTGEENGKHQTAAAHAAVSANYLFEPARDELLKTLVPKLIKFEVFFALLENAAGEHGARMTAMDNATTNCVKMIDHYTLMRNRARQAAITTELIEIISGAEAL